MSHMRKTDTKVLAARMYTRNDSSVFGISHDLSQGVNFTIRNAAIPVSMKNRAYAAGRLNNSGSPRFRNKG